MQGILMGVILTVLLFVVRYSMIRVIESRQTLESLRSSVERSSQCNEILAQEGDKMVVYNLRGYIFFGSANRIVDTVLDDSTAENQELQAIVMDMSHVTGIDISALNKFSQIKKVCEARNTLLIYAAVPLELKNKMMAVNGANQGSVDELFFDQVDFAIEFLEEKTLEKNGSTTESISVDEVLFDLIKNKEKVSLIVNALKRLEYRKGDCIFSQGDENDGFYILESGALHASVEVNQKQLRVKKFRAGSLVGELSAYLRSKSRTATIVADQDSIVYHLSLTDYNRLSEKDEYLVGCIHELLATALAERVNFMNHRLCQ
jgi:SulP family sulfate permease